MSANHPQRGPSPAKPGDNRSSLLFWLGCASVSLILLLVAVGVIMMIMLRRNAMEARGGPGPGWQRPALQADWRQVLRADAHVPPEGARLAPARTDTGNALAVLRSVALPSPYAIAYLRLARRLPTDSADRPAVAALIRDSAADRVAAAARVTRYDAIPLILADTTQVFELFGVRLPHRYMWSRSFRTVEFLLARGVARERAGRLAQAREDYRAVVGLGLMMFAHEPSIAGSGQGLRYVAEGAGSLKAIAGRDTATGNAADRLAAWAGRVRSDQYRITTALGRELDSLLAAATDTSLPFQMRAEAIHSSAMSFLNGGWWSIYRGPSKQTFAALRTVQRGSDPDLAALALAYDTALTRMDRVGGWTRLHQVMHGQR